MLWAMSKRREDGKAWGMTIVKGQVKEEKIIKEAEKEQLEKKINQEPREESFIKKKI